MLCVSILLSDSSRVSFRFRVSDGAQYTRGIEESSTNLIAEAQQTGFRKLTRKPSLSRI
jgi:hypothetical protein